MAGSRVTFSIILFHVGKIFYLLVSSRNEDFNPNKGDVIPPIPTDDIITFLLLFEILFNFVAHVISLNWFVFSLNIVLFQSDLKYLYFVFINFFLVYVIIYLL